MLHRCCANFFLFVAGASGSALSVVVYPVHWSDSSGTCDSRAEQRINISELYFLEMDFLFFRIQTGKRLVVSFPPPTSSPRPLSRLLPSPVRLSLLDDEPLRSSFDLSCGHSTRAILPTTLHEPPSTSQMSPPRSSGQGVIPILAAEFFESHSAQSSSPLARPHSALSTTASARQNQERIAASVRAGKRAEEGIATARENTSSAGDIFSWSDKTLADRYQVSIAPLHPPIRSDRLTGCLFLSLSRKLGLEIGYSFRSCVVCLRTDL